jgi:RNA polymerase sigma factor (sigma-70 family)
MPSEMAKFNHLRFFFGALSQSLPATNQENKMNSNPILIPESVEKNVHLKAMLFAGKHGFSSFEIEDIEQELRMMLIIQIPNYKPKRASFETYCDRIISSRLKSLAKKYYAGKNVILRHADDLRKIEDDNTSSNNSESGKSKKVEVPYSFPFHELNLKADIETLFRLLSEEQRKFCEALMDGLSLAQIAKQHGINKYTLYVKHIKPLRKLCVEINLQKYLEKVRPF